MLKASNDCQQLKDWKTDPQSYLPVCHYCHSFSIQFEGFVGETILDNDDITLLFVELGKLTVRLAS